MAKVCSIEGCGKPNYGNGLCSKHWMRNYRHGDPHFVGIVRNPNPPDACIVRGCDGKHRAKGYCSKHYTRYLRYGDANHPLLRAAAGEPARWIESHKMYEGDDCLKWPFAMHSTGYGIASLHGNSMMASRAMCIAAHGEPKEESMQAAHLCGKGHEGCVNPRHLQWKTPAENNDDKRAHNTLRRGEEIGNSILTEVQVREILASKATNTVVGYRYGVSASAISAIRNGKNWQHLSQSNRRSG